MPAPTNEAIRAAAAARRLDDAFRSYLAERGAKRLPLAEVTSLVTGVVGLRLAGDAVLDLWQHDDEADGDRTTARRELLATTEQMTGWYRNFAAALTGPHHVPEPLNHDELADQRLIDAVRHDLRGEDGQATATAVRMIWTGDHLDAARRLQDTLAGPAQTAVLQRALIAGWRSTADSSSARPLDASCPIGRGYCVIAHWLRAGRDPHLPSGHETRHTHRCSCGHGSSPADRAGDQRLWRRR